LLPAARRECLGVLREAARKAVGEATYLPGWISDATDSVEWDLTDLSRERLEWKPTPAEEEMEEEVYATIDALEDRGAFEGLGFLERMDFEFHVEHRIRSKYESRISKEAEEARKKRRWPKSNPTLITEKDTLNSVLDVLHRRGVLDEIDAADFLRAPMEEDDAQDLARKARTTAAVCGCCGRKLSLEESAYFGAKVYVGMWALYWDRVSKPQICKPHYERTVLCASCAPEWLLPERDNVVTQLCANCERPMVSLLQLSSVDRTFCSDPCRQAYHNQLRKEKRTEERKKVCEICGKEFTATRGDAKTCSERCKQKAYRRRKKEVNQNR
jgi:predicted nucleic acid-binding Zn ribbon protein